MHLQHCKSFLLCTNTAATCRHLINGKTPPTLTMLEKSAAQQTKTNLTFNKVIRTVSLIKFLAQHPWISVLSRKTKHIDWKSGSKEKKKKLRPLAEGFAAQSRVDAPVCFYLVVCGLMGRRAAGRRSYERRRWDPFDHGSAAGTNRQAEGEERRTSPAGDS